MISIFLLLVKKELTLCMSMKMPDKSPPLVAPSLATALELPALILKFVPISRAWDFLGGWGCHNRRRKQLRIGGADRIQLVCELIIYNFSKKYFYNTGV